MAVWEFSCLRGFFPKNDCSKLILVEIQVFGPHLFAGILSDPAECFTIHPSGREKYCSWIIWSVIFEALDHSSHFFQWRVYFLERIVAFWGPGDLIFWLFLNVKGSSNIRKHSNFDAKFTSAWIGFHFHYFLDWSRFCCCVKTKNGEHVALLGYLQGGLDDTRQC